MKVLFVVPYVPSLVRTRSYNFIRSLSARGHQVTVVTASSGERDAPALDQLRSISHDVHAVRVPRLRALWNCGQALPGSDPLQAWYSWSPELAARAAALQASADVVHVEHLRGVRYALHLQSNRSTSAPPIVWDSVDCISHLFAQAAEARMDLVGRLVCRFELPRTRGYEGRMAGEFDRVLITSPVDREALVAAMPGSARARQAGVCIVPNGVDTTYFSPSDAARSSRMLVFSGKMSYHANVASVQHLVAAIMPRVWAQAPDVELFIVGQDPPRRVRQLATTRGPRVVVTGGVPDLRPYLRRAAAAVVPLVYGAGSQFKVLEAMACGTPVVATPRAVGALTVAPGRDVLVAEGGQAFAEAVLGLIESPSQQRNVGRAGRLYVESHHQWDRIAARLEAIYLDALAERSGAPLKRVAG